ncbi:magnesium transporter [Salipaludibacillus agaradhaerens]|jgi:magnesium transporter|uniref:Magnesium transporter MgtE n=1 Tax=Salipaludibacillus agaradhaerens TaxID=76935 RepID=A0A9Q4B3R6_SALAG|nr:magnesium transporter [Salipaludibacillus agaradhaerens]MCR6097813.1 magnesium transporter [Salipaludibacillus agaradhaerens]MCR6116558.1 magnesium transporter [Salipaludibacillus agaradhaerens]
MDTDKLTVLTIKYLKEQNRPALQDMTEELHPYDLAELYKALPEKHHFKFLTFITSKDIADLVMELEPDMQKEVLQKLGIEKSSKIMDIMDNDDLADLLSEISQEKLEEYLSAMQTDESKTVQHLMSYPPETAGGIMTNEFVWIRDYYTVRDAVDKFKSFAEYTRNIYYLYVIDEHKKLVGVVSYRDLLLADMNEKIFDIMFNRVISVAADTDQEDVAQIIQRYDFLAVPVVDKQNVLKGIVTVDDVIDVVLEEAQEDIEKLSASGKDIDFQTKAYVASYRRLPWLILLLFIGLISGSILDSFEDTLEQVVALIFFMPMIAGMTGNTGTQSLAVVVRGLVTNETDRKTILKLVWREFKVGIIIGLVCGLLVFFVATFWQSIMFGVVVGISLLATLIIGTMAGTIIPLILYKIGLDPAVASGPLITTLNDIFSLLIYFGIATNLMHMLI